MASVELDALTSRVTVGPLCQAFERRRDEFVHSWRLPLKAYHRILATRKRPRFQTHLDRFIPFAHLDADPVLTCPVKYPVEPAAARPSNGFLQGFPIRY